MAKEIYPGKRNSLDALCDRLGVNNSSRTLHGALLDASAHFMAGRFLRARKAAELVIDHERALANAGGNLPHATSLKALAHILAAEASHALQDKTNRHKHLNGALAEAEHGTTVVRQTLKEGGLLRAARWSLDDRDAVASLAWLDQLPQGVARRTVAMRLRLKASRLADQPAQALDTALLLAKHRAFSSAAADSIVRGLVLDLLAHTHETDQLLRVWQSLGSAQRLTPELAVQAAQLAAGAGVSHARPGRQGGLSRSPSYGPHPRCRLWRQGGTPAYLAHLRRRSPPHRDRSFPLDADRPRG
jgi:HemY protein